MATRIRMLHLIHMGWLILLAALPVQAGLPQAKNQVLIIHSYHSGLAWTDDVMNGIRDTFGRSHPHIQTSAEYLDANRYMFDYRQIERFHIPLSKLPKDAVFVNRPDSVYDRYKTLVWATVTVVSALGVLVVLLGIAILRQRKAEQALKISEERMRLFFERQIVGMAITTPEKRWLQVNDRVCRMLGYSREELAHLTWAELTHPDDLALDMAHFERLLAGEINEYALEKRLIRKDGTPIVINLSVGCVRNKNGSVDYVPAVLEDITERKRAEELLKESREFLSSIIENLPNMIFIKDARELKFVQFNQAGENLLGYKREDLIGKDVYDIFPTDQADFFTQKDREVLESGRLFDVSEETVDTAMGTRILHTKKMPIVNKDGTPAYLLGISEDITELKAAEEALLLEKERLNALLQLGFMTDARESDIIHFAMEAAVRLTKSTLGYVAFMNDDETILTMFAWSQSAMKECAVKDTPITYPVSATGLWGEAVRQRRPIITNDYSAPNAYKKGFPKGHVHIVRHMNAPVFDNDKIVIVAGVGNKAGDYDDGDVRQLTLLMSGLWTIIRRKRFEDEREKLQAQLGQAQKLESVGRLAGGVAHDFNNMLTAILGHTELATMLCAPTDPIHAKLKAIEESALRSADLVKQLLAFARKQTIAPKVLDLNDAAGGMLKMLQRLMGEDIDLVWKPKTGLWPVRIDPSQIDQLLANLCVNARDAITGVGNVTIETANAAFDEAYCDVNPGFVPGEYVMLAVSDDGEGIDKNVLDHIFEPFFTTKESGRGTGLGLSTVYGIVKQNDGFIKVYSEPGKGSCFKIYLPRVAGKASEPKAEGRAEPPRGSGETILMVEDEPVILDVGREMLEALGYKVLTADTPGKALRLVKAHAHEIQLVLTDVVMPEMNGRDLAKALRDIKPGLRCLFASGYTADVIVHHGVLDEGVVFIQKPFSIQSLAVKVREALEQK